MSSLNSNSRAKTMSVISLLNYTSQISDKSSIVTSSQTAASPNVSVSVTTVNDVTRNNVPTVAKSDLLYKSVSSTPPPLQLKTMPPLAPTKVTATGKVAYIQPNPQQNVCYANPLSKMKTLTNSLSVTTPSYIHIRPAPSVSSTLTSHQVILASNLVQTSLSVSSAQPLLVTSIAASHKMEIVSCVNTKPVNIVNKPSMSKIPSSTISENKTILNAAITSQQIRNSQHIFSQLKKERFQQGVGIMKRSNGSKLPDLSLPGVSVPRGWSRLLEKDNITYISPNKSKIRNKEDLINYLELEGTCKCGLECPLKVDETFNFDPKIPSKFNPATLIKEDIKCKTHQKFTEQFPPTTKIKLDRRGRKPGQKAKRPSESDEQSSLDRKRISLTGVSPLEMFQSGMNAINALHGSSTSLGTNKANELRKDPPKIVSLDNMKLAGNNASILLTRYPIVQLATASSTSTTTSIPTSTRTAVSLNENVTALIPTQNSTSGLVINPSNTDAIVSSVVSGLKRRQKKIPKGRGKDTVKPEKKSKIRKALPNAAIHKASELQLHKIVNSQQKAFLVNHVTGQQAATTGIPSLRSITSVPENATQEQLLAAQALLSAQAAKTTIVPQKQVTVETAMLNQQAQKVISESLGNAKIERTNATISTNINTIIISPPPNRTVSSANHLTEALFNQLNVKPNEGNLKSIPGGSPTSVLTAAASARLVADTVGAPGSLSISISSGAEKSVDTPNISSPTIASTMNHFITSKTTQDSRATKAQPKLSPVLVLSSPNKTSMVNKPIHSSLTTQQNVIKSSMQNNGGQMLQFYLVSQNSMQGTTAPGKVNSPILRAYTVPSQTNPNSKLLVMNKGNASQALQTLALQQTSKNQKLVNSHSKNNALQIQNVLPMQMIPSKLSPSKNTNLTQIQYVKTINTTSVHLHPRPGNPLSSQPRGFPLVQYITTAPYVIPTVSSSVRKSVPLLTSNNFVRIAPGPSTTDAAVSVKLAKEQKQEEEELLRKLQEQLFSTSKKTPATGEMIVVSSNLSNANSSHGASSTGESTDTQAALTSVIQMPTNSNTNTSPVEKSKTQSSPSEHSGKCVNTTAESRTRTESTNCTNFQPSLTSTSTISTFVNVFKHQSTASLSSPASVKTGVVMSSRKSTEMIQGNRQDSFEEISLHCDERPSDLITNSDEKSNKPPTVVSELKRSSPQIERNYSLDSQKTVTPSSNILINEETTRRKEDLLGTIVWVDGEGFPCWPAKVVREPRPNKSSLPDDQEERTLYLHRMVYVRWYGLQHVQAVSIGALKSFHEGFMAHESSREQRKFRTNRKQAIELEKAIAEAVKDIERQNQEGRT